MAGVSRIEGVQSLIAKLRARAAAATKANDVSAVVGYSTAYAIHVHENLEAFHKNGQAKYLEEPARTLTADGTLSDIITSTVARGGTLAQGLLLAGLRLQRESQLLVPVDTGRLKNSAFTRIEQGS